MVRGQRQSTTSSASPDRSPCRRRSRRRQTRCGPSTPSPARRSCAATPRPATRRSPWTRERRAVARIEATALGLDIRFIVTSLRFGTAEWLYDSLYCARGQAENLIKLHKTQLASDRTSCRLGARQPDAPRAAHSRLLADAHRARRHPQATRSRHGRVRHAASAPAEGRPPASSRPRAASASPSPPPVPRPSCSARCRTRSGPPRHERRGRRPVHPPRFSNAFPISAGRAQNTER